MTILRHLASDRHVTLSILRTIRFAANWPAACPAFGVGLPRMAGMTFRVQRAPIDDNTVVLTLSGDIGGRHSADLQALFDAERDQRLVLDLTEAAVVDRAGVLLLARTESSGGILTNCPAYVREWIDRERQDAGLRGGAPAGAEHQMAQEAAKPATEGTFQSADGLRIFFRTWEPAVLVRATVAIVPGFNSHSGYYDWVARQSAALGIATCAVDLRGRGRSDGERFYVSKFADYVDDVAGLVKEARSRHPGLPMFLLGHSAGGVVSCLYALDHQQELAGLICESFAFQVPAPDFALAVFKGLSHVAPHAHVLHLKNEDFSRDPEVVARMNADPLIAHETQPTQTLAEMVRADERLKTAFPAFTMPLLILHGTSDKATRPAGSQFFYDTATSGDKTLKLYDGYFHDPLNDLGKEAVLSDIVAWIGARLPAA
jgi:alpha-beta hydrolase superfamily lysophospholipase